MVDASTGYWWPDGRDALRLSEALHHRCVILLSRKTGKNFKRETAMKQRKTRGKRRAQQVA
jgi:hypothetical protein